LVSSSHRKPHTKQWPLWLLSKVWRCLVLSKMCNLGIILFLMYSNLIGWLRWLHSKELFLKTGEDLCMTGPRDGPCLMLPTGVSIIECICHQKRSPIEQKWPMWWSPMSAPLASSQRDYGLEGCNSSGLGPTPPNRSLKNVMDRLGQVSSGSIIYMYAFTWCSQRGTPFFKPSQTYGVSPWGSLFQLKMKQWDKAGIMGWILWTWAMGAPYKWGEHGHSVQQIWSWWPSQHHSPLHVKLWRAIVWPYSGHENEHPQENKRWLVSSGVRLRAGIPLSCPSVYSLGFQVEWVKPLWHIQAGGCLLLILKCPPYMK
jgi:hypothetical protein